MKNPNQISLSGLRAVEAVGRQGNLRAAAEEFGVTVGAVSQQIQKVEAQLGVRLFERRARQLVLTARGEAMLPHLDHAMRELKVAVMVASRDSGDTLTVSVAPIFAAKWLVWRLPRFNERHPNVRIRVDATETLVDPDVSDVDVCIRVGRGGWPGIRAEKLIDHRVFPVCGPALAERLHRPADLAEVPIIRDPDSMFGWNVWLEPNGLDDSILGDGPVFSDGSLCLDAAVAGQGVFLAWETLAWDALAAGRVVAPFPGRYESGFSYWLVSSRQTKPSQALRDFSAWLREALAESSKSA